MALGSDAAVLAAFGAALTAQSHSVEAASFDAHGVGKIKSFFGGLKRLDVLVNNIGFMQGKSFAALAPEDFATTYAATVTTAFETMHRLARAAHRGRGVGRCQCRQQCHVWPGGARCAGV